MHNTLHIGPIGQKRTYDCFYVCLYVFQNLYVCFFVLQNSYECLYGLPNLYVCFYVIKSSYVRLYVLQNLYVHLYVLQNLGIFACMCNRLCKEKVMKDNLELSGNALPSRRGPDRI